MTTKIATNFNKFTYSEVESTPPPRSGKNHTLMSIISRLHSLSSCHHKTTNN